MIAERQWYILCQLTVGKLDVAPCRRALLTHLGTKRFKYSWSLSLHRERRG